MFLPATVGWIETNRFGAAGHTTPEDPVTCDTEGVTFQGPAREIHNMNLRSTFKYLDEIRVAFTREISFSTPFRTWQHLTKGIMTTINEPSAPTSRHCAHNVFSKRLPHPNQPLVLKLGREEKTDRSFFARSTLLVMKAMVASPKPNISSVTGREVVKQPLVLG